MSAHDLEGDRYDTMAAEILRECMEVVAAQLSDWEWANLQDVLATNLRARLAEVEGERDEAERVVCEVHLPHAHGHCSCKICCRFRARLGEVAGQPLTLDAIRAALEGKS